MFFVFSMRLSPIQPESGSTGTDCATKSFFQPTLRSVLHLAADLVVARLG